MTNQDVFRYRPIAVCDSHFHLSVPQKVDDSVKIFSMMMEYFDLERMALMCYTHNADAPYPADNAKALYIKDVMNKANPARHVYAFGSFHHYMDSRDTAEGYLAQVKRMHALGFDGIKLLDGKPGLYKRLARRLDDARYDPALSYAEEMGIPVTLHVGDPPSFWDPAQITEAERTRGWFCDETFPTLPQLRAETEGLLKKHPKLRVVLAHFYFIAHDYEACVRLMETYPNIMLDLTPGGVMFAEFSKCPEKWRQFFVRYADRILYGTDTYNIYLCEKAEDYGRNYTQHRINLLRRALEYAKPFEDPNYGTIIPLALDDGTLTKIYRENFIRLCGEARDVRDSETSDYAAELLSLYAAGELSSGDAQRDALDTENLRRVYDYFLVSDMVTN